MNKLAIIAILFVGVTRVALSAETNKTNALVITITAAQAKDHIDTEATVTGTVFEVNKAEKLVRLNFDKPFPNQTFTAVVFASKTNLFPEIEKLKGKKVEVTGKIAAYRDRPQIVLNSTNQLKLVESEAK